MKYLFAPNTMSESSDVYALKIILDTEEIPCSIRNEYLSIALGELSHQDCIPALWVLNDADYPRALKVMEEWRSSSVKTKSQWVCTECGETIEGQFSSCWKCSKPQEES